MNLAELERAVEHFRAARAEDEQKQREDVAKNEAHEIDQRLRAAEALVAQMFSRTLRTELQMEVRPSRSRWEPATVALHYRGQPFFGDIYSSSIAFSGERITSEDDLIALFAEYQKREQQYAHHLELLQEVTARLEQTARGCAWSAGRQITLWCWYLPSGGQDLSAWSLTPPPGHAWVWLPMRRRAWVQAPTAWAEQVTWSCLEDVAPALLIPLWVPFEGIDVQHGEKRPDHMSSPLRVRRRSKNEWEEKTYHDPLLIKDSHSSCELFAGVALCPEFERQMLRDTNAS